MPAPRSFNRNALVNTSRFLGSGGRGQANHTATATPQMSASAAQLYGIQPRTTFTTNTAAGIGGGGHGGFGDGVMRQVLSRIMRQHGIDRTAQRPAASIYENAQMATPPNVGMQQMGTAPQIGPLGFARPQYNFGTTGSYNDLVQRMRNGMPITASQLPPRTKYGANQFMPAVGRVPGLSDIKNNPFMRNMGGLRLA